MLAVAEACAQTPARAPEVAVPFHVIGHRGAAGHAPENTLAAFAAADALGVDEVELDVRLSRDGALVLFHDDDLAAKTQLSGRVEDHDLAELVRADLGPWFGRQHPRRRGGTATGPLSRTYIATLGEVFAAYGPRFVYHLEVKGAQPSLPARILDAVREAGLQGRVRLTSFSFAQLQRARALDAQVPIDWLARSPRTPLWSLSSGESEALLAQQVEMAERAREAHFDGICFRASQASRELVEAVHERGLEMRAYGVRDARDMEHAIAVGANGMTIDWPDLLQARLAALEASGASGTPAD